MFALLLLACKPDCPPGSTLGDDGLCYLAEGDSGDVCDGLTYTSAGQPYLLTYCTGCHSAGMSGEWRRDAPEGTDFETLSGVHTWSDRIAARVEAGTMPPGGGAPANQTERLLAWLDCGAPGADNLIPEGGTPPVGEAMELAVGAEEDDDGTLVVVREAEVGTRLPGSTWSTERYTVIEDDAWWHGYTLYDADGAVLRSVVFTPEILLTATGTETVDVDIEEGETTFNESWSVSVTVSEDALPIDGLEATWDFTEVLLLAGQEEHGWHLSDSRGTIARWVILDADRTWSAIQIAEAFYNGEGFPLAAEFRWLERIIVPGGWSL